MVTTVAGARRLARPVSGKDGPGRGLGLGERVIGLAPGAGTRVGAVTITATLARHGPFYAPQVHEVVGFLLDVESGPRIWISGDTVLYPALAAELAELGLRRPVDVAVVHCGAVRFPRVPVLGKERFTFDAREAIEACRLVQARKIVPVHRSGWSHFLQPEAELEAAFASSELAERTTVLDLGATLRLT